MKQHAEVRMLEIEKLIRDYVKNELGVSCKLSALHFHEVADCSAMIDWNKLKYISIEVEF